MNCTRIIASIVKLRRLGAPAAQGPRAVYVAAAGDTCTRTAWSTRSFTSGITLSDCRSPSTHTAGWRSADAVCDTVM